MRFSRTAMPFDSQPTLQGRLLEVRPLRADDHDALYAAASDPAIWEQHPQNRNEPDVFREFFREHLASGGAVAVIERATGELVGTSRYARYDEARSEVEIGWTFLVRRLWGGTHNRELKELMLGHAFRHVDTVFFLVNHDNRRSQRALEKIGAVRAGTHVDALGVERLRYELGKNRRPGPVR